LSDATASTVSDDAIAAGAGASGPEDAHAPMHIESAATEICLIIVSSKLGSESHYEFHVKQKPADSQPVLNLT
jgi:hypothetical protein